MKAKRMVLNLLDLFSGLGGWSNPWEKAGHRVFRVELSERFKADHGNVLDLKLSDLPWIPDVILASPPCTSYSVMSMGKHWTRDNRPKTATARMGIRLVRKTISLIKEFKPKLWIIENPMAKLRRFEEMAGFDRRTVTYCQYGDFRMKPTDLWGTFPSTLQLKPMCRNGSGCHASAPRGSRTGTQGMDKYESAKIPEGLSLAIMEGFTEYLRLKEEADPDLCRSKQMSLGIKLPRPKPLVQVLEKAGLLQ